MSPVFREYTDQEYEQIPYMATDQEHEQFPYMATQRANDIKYVMSIDPSIFREYYNHDDEINQQIYLMLTNDYPVDAFKLIFQDAYENAQYMLTRDSKFSSEYKHEYANILAQVNPEKFDNLVDLVDMILESVGVGCCAPHHMVPTKIGTFNEKNSRRYVWTLS